MNEKQLSLICLGIILFGSGLFLVSYQTDFEKTTSFELELDKEGILFGKVEYVIKNSPNTIFVFNDGNKTLAYYPKESTLAKNDFLTIYVKKQIYQGDEELYVYKVIIE